MTQTSAAEQIEGTCLVVGGACIFALVALIIQRDPLPVMLATECRFLVSWVVGASFMIKYRVSRGLHWFGPPGMRKWIVLKSMTSFVFITLWWGALRRAPVGDCIAIIYAAPIVTSLVSNLCLGEAVPRHFPVQVLLVVLGTVLVVDPPFVHRLLSPGANTGPAGDYTYLFLALFVGAAVPVLTRKAKSCSWIEVEHVNALLSFTVFDPSLVIGTYLAEGTWPQLPVAAPSAIALMVLASLGSFLATCMETKGYQLAEVGKASMFRYVEVPFAYVLQKLGTTEPVRVQAVVGGLLIIGSCFLSLNRIRASGSSGKLEEKLVEKSDPDSKNAALLGA
eukprot:TRINITY_DN103451_c0_g1_i1.p1 TRINITY_DN103451_c0_g1~~TRINITY_DN103451_c0_g1_i1.p1  ORF type:complete len:336 (+),score=37.92 TRINITY_DN103451_c0_g1_i1:66-1073(+)